MHVSVYAFEPQSVLTYQTDAQGAIKNLTAGHNDLTIYSTAYGRLLMIQLSVQNQDLLDVYWFLARLHLTAHIDTWPDPTAYEHKQPPFPGLDQTQVFLHVCVFSLSLYGFLYVGVLQWPNVRLFTVCALLPPPPMKWVYWVAICAALGPNFRLPMCDVFGVLAVSAVWCLSLPLGDGCDRLFFFFFKQPWPLLRLNKSRATRLPSKYTNAS